VSRCHLYHSVIHTHIADSDNVPGTVTELCHAVTCTILSHTHTQQTVTMYLGLPLKYITLPLVTHSYRLWRERGTTRAKDVLSNINRRQACTAIPLSPPAATQWFRLLLLAVYGLQRSPYYVLLMGMTPQFLFFVLGDLDLSP